jgi:hypothetical protein
VLVLLRLLLWRWRRGVLLVVLLLLLLRSFPRWLPVLLCGGVSLLLGAAATVRCRPRCCCCCCCCCCRRCVQLMRWLQLLRL